MSRARNNVYKLAVRRDVERDFGAVDSTSVDSGAALEAAFAWVSADPSRELEMRGSTYTSARQLAVHRARVVGRAVLRFTGLGASTDCLLLQGSTAEEPLVWEGIDIDANGVGRDAVRLTGGRAGSTQCDYLRAAGFRIVGAVRDALRIEPAAGYCWLEDFAFRDVRITQPGRHGVAFVMPDLPAVFANQGNFENCEIRGAGRTTTGYDIYCDTQATSYGAAKVSELTFIGCEFDADGGPQHGQALVRLERSGTVGGDYDGWVFVGCTAEDVSGSIITGFPDVVTLGANAMCRGLVWIGGVVAQYGQIITPSAQALRPVVLQSTSGRNRLDADGPLAGTTGTFSGAVSLASVNAPGTANLPINTGGGTQVQVMQVASAVSQLQLQGAAAGGAVLMRSFNGNAGTAVTLAYNTNAGGSHDFSTGGNSFLKQFQVAHVAGADSWVAAQGGVVGSSLTSVYATGPAANIGLALSAKGAGAVQVGASGNTVGFYGAAGAAKASVTGSRGGNAALASLLTALASVGLITDGSTA